jgi:hypothetical protein
MSNSTPPRDHAPIDGGSLPEALVSLLSLALVAFIGWNSFTLSLEKTGNTGLAPRAMTACTMDQNGYLRGELFGSVKQTLNWQGATMACDGMPKPGGSGIRLAFREHLDPDTPGLSFVIGIDAAIPGQPFDELAANVTLNDQPGGRFYSTQGQQQCWVSMTELQELRGTVENIWRINGLLYCAGALSAAAGTGSVTLVELEFSGQVRAEAE